MNQSHVDELDKIIGGEDHDLMFRAFVGKLENTVTETEDLCCVGCGCEIESGEKCTDCLDNDIRGMEYGL